jgi:PKD repeat protein
MMSPRRSPAGRAATKRLINFCFLVPLLCLAADRSTAQVLAGPVINPANGHAYFLLASNSWTRCETQAVALGGHLATINDSEEQDWIVSTFGSYGGVNRELWIGFRSTTTPTPASAFSWVSGQATTYTNWAPPEPNDPPGIPSPSLYVRVYPPDHSQYPGGWDNFPNSYEAAGIPGTNPNGVVETLGVEPIARFTFSPSSPAVGQPVSFIDQSTGSPTSWSWTFGDQGNSSSQNPVHTYMSAGDFNVTLLATNLYGGDITTKLITVGAPSPPGCVPDPTTLCVNDGRFGVTALWRIRDGTSGQAIAFPLTADTGYFWFFSPGNVEVVVKVLNACDTTFQAYWVFAAGLTNVEVTLTVTDTATEEVRTYTNPLGVAFAPVQDTSAFLTCP